MVKKNRLRAILALLESRAYLESQSEVVKRRLRRLMTRASKINQN